MGPCSPAARLRRACAGARRCQTAAAALPGPQFPRRPAAGAAGRARFRRLGRRAWESGTAQHVSETMTSLYRPDSGSPAGECGFALFSTHGHGSICAGRTNCCLINAAFGRIACAHSMKRCSFAPRQMFVETGEGRPSNTTMEMPHLVNIDECHKAVLVGVQAQAVVVHVDLGVVLRRLAAGRHARRP